MGMLGAWIYSEGHGDLVSRLIVGIIGVNIWLMGNPGGIQEYKS